MKSIFSTALVVLTVTLTSFTLKPETETNSFKNFGTYIGGGTIENSPIQLQLNKNFTYSYRDVTNEKNKVKITGTWKQDGKHIKLNGNQEVKFHNNWKIDPNCNCLKSKKGLTYYRICED